MKERDPIQSVIRTLKTPKTLTKTIEGITLALITLTIYLATTSRISGIATAVLITTYYVILGFLFYSSANRPFSPTKRFCIFLFTGGTLLWVGITGWINSPFFYALYIVGIALAFLVDRAVLLSFVLTLTGILLSHIGVLTPFEQFIAISVLFCLIPLSLLLRQEFLKRTAEERKIFILQRKNKVYENTIDELLSNDIHRIAILLRERLAKIRFFSLYYESKPSRVTKDVLKTLIELSEESLEILGEFEEEATGKKIHRKK